MAKTHSPRFARPSNLDGQLGTIRKASVLCTLHSVLCTALCSVLLLASCTNDDDNLIAEQDITLTTPVVQLSSLHSPLSTRSTAQSLEDVAEWASIYLYLHDSEAREQNTNRTGSYLGSLLQDDNWAWNAEDAGFVAVTVTGGEGHYRAGIHGLISLKATADMPAIVDAIYAYRGSINVKADGTFTPDGTLQPYSSAVKLILKDADGKDIVGNKYDTPDGEYAEGDKMNSDVYRIKPVGFARMLNFVEKDADGNVVSDNGQSFPNGTADPAPAAWTWDSYPLINTADGQYTPGSYPATWEVGGPLVTSVVPTSAWPLFEVTYCTAGFEWSDEADDYVPLGPTTTWTVNYPAEPLTLEPGKLYTFTATLGRDAHITLAPGSVTITDWTEGDVINIGK